MNTMANKRVGKMAREPKDKQINKLEFCKFDSGKKIETSLDAYYFFLNHLDENSFDKQYQAIILDDSNVIRYNTVFTPSKHMDQKIAFKKVLEFAKNHDLNKIYFAENNLEKSIFPSTKQESVANYLLETAKDFKVDIIDQMIISDRSYFSFSENDFN